MANKANNKRTSAKNNVVDTPAIAPVVAPSAPATLSMLELVALIASATPEQFKAMRNPIAANVLDGTKGSYKSADGKGVTTDVALAKRSDVSTRLIPVKTNGLANHVVNGITVDGTDAFEISKLLGFYATDAYGTLAIATAKRAQLKRELNQSEIDAILRGCKTDAVRPRYTKAGTMASQYARHFAVFQYAMQGRILSGKADVATK